MKITPKYKSDKENAPDIRAFIKMFEKRVRTIDRDQLRQVCNSAYDTDHLPYYAP